MNTVAFQGTVSGRVQGVFFRDSMRKRAQLLGVRGWVRNLPDGRVEWLICGEASAIEAILGWLQEGPPAAIVTGIDYAPIVLDDKLNKLADFVVKR